MRVDRLLRLVERRWSTLRVARARASGVEIGSNVTFLGRPLLARAAGSKICVGYGVTLVSSSRQTALGVTRKTILRTINQNAEIHIGSDSGVSGAAIVANLRVSIGERVLIGSEVLICDTDFHDPDVVPRRYLPVPLAKEGDAINIEDDVFVGARSVVLKGVTIGKGSVIAAGSVVTRDVPPMVVAAGSPARVIRPLHNKATHGLVNRGG